MSTATAPYRWCTLYVDSADQAAVVADLGRLLATAAERDVLTVPGYTLDVRRNPDRTGGDHFLDWPTVVEVDAAPGVPDRDVVGFVSMLIARLRAAGHRVGAESDFADELPRADSR